MECHGRRQRLVPTGSEEGDYGLLWGTGRDGGLTVHPRRGLLTSELSPRMPSSRDSAYGFVYTLYY